MSKVIGNLQQRIAEVRFAEGVEKVEHVPYSTGDQFWVRFSRTIDMKRLEEIVGKHGYRIVRFASLPSKLPRGLSEVLWDGVSHVVTKDLTGWQKFTSKLGFEPDGIAKLARDLHGPNQIFMAMNEEGIRLLYEYLGLKYAPPPPPTQPKPSAAPAAKPAPPAPPKPPTSQSAVAQPPPTAPGAAPVDEPSASAP